MFVKTVKLKKPNPVAIVIILAAVLILVAVWIIDAGGKGIGDKYKLPTNTERKAFLVNLGWDVSDKETECRVVKIPSKFNAIYNTYNKMQKQQGFDLSKLKGEDVEIYTYEVYNYPGNKKDIVAHLIICKGKLVGGDVCSLSSDDGFIHGLMPVNKEGMNNSEGKSNESANDARTTTPPQATQSPAQSQSTESTKATESTQPSVTTTVSENENNGSDFFFTTPRS